MSFYQEFHYLYPPRPENAVTAGRIPFYEKSGYVGQYKKNGTCSIFAIKAPDIFISMTRHNDNHKQWGFSKYFKDCFAKYCEPGFWYYFIGEVLHSKTVEIKDTVYIFDVLVSESLLLYGETFENRQNTLKRIFKADEKDEDYSHYIIEDRFWLAKNFESGIYQKFKDIKNTSVDEGFVLKKKNSILEDCSKKSNNQSWQMKFRHPKKNYQF